MNGEVSCGLHLLTAHVNAEMIGQRTMLPGDLDQVARQAIAKWDLPDVTVISLSLSENAVYEVVPTDNRDERRWILRLCLRPLGVEEIESEVWWLDRIHEDTQLECPCPVRGGNAGLLQLVRSHVASATYKIPCVLFLKLDGEPVHEDHIVERDADAAGGVIAQLHHHSLSLTLPRWFTRRTLRIDDLVGPDASWGDPLAVDLQPDTLRLFAVTVDELRKFFVCRPQLRCGLIHADLHLGNILFTKAGVAALDFDDCGFGYLAYDLAVFLKAIRQHPRFPEIATSLLHSYLRLFSIPPDDLDAIGPLMVARGLQSVAWVAARLERPGFKHELVLSVASATQLCHDFLRREDLLSLRLEQ